MNRTNRLYTIEGVKGFVFSLESRYASLTGTQARSAYSDLLQTCNSLSIVFAHHSLFEDSDFMLAHAGVASATLSRLGYPPDQVPTLTSQAFVDYK